MKQSPKSRKRKTTSKPKLITLPSTNVEMENFIDKNKSKMYESVVDSIKYAVDKNVGLIEVFYFDNSGYLVVLAKKDYLDTLQNIFNQSLTTENYELCGKIHPIVKILSAPKFSKEQVSVKLV